MTKKLQKKTNKNWVKNKKTACKTKITINKKKKEGGEKDVNN